MSLTICGVTGSRADWGLLAPVFACLRDDPAFALKIAVTGQHLVAGAGDSLREIMDEGFEVAETIDMGLLSDTPMAISNSLGLALSGFGAAFARLQPDLLLVLGDRYEILGAATAAALARIPVAHIAGGDVTEGAMDDAFRHAITKLAHLHFVTTADAGRRVRQLGEHPDRVFVVGSPGLDRIRTMALLDREALFAAVGLSPRPTNLMVTFHPETLAADTETHCTEMLAALDRLGPATGLLFSGTNSDVQGLAIQRLVRAFVEAHDNAVFCPSLGSAKYFSALKHVDAVVGNSSSGLYEAPSFGTPVVNIGDRQKGRERASCVKDVPPTREAIFAGVQQALKMPRTDVRNPYGDGHTAQRIVTTLKQIGDPKDLLKKRFVDWTSQ